MDKLIELLDARRGKWPAIAKASGVNISTICRIADGTTKYPRHETVQSLISAARKVKANTSLTRAEGVAVEAPVGHGKD